MYAVNSTPRRVSGRDGLPAQRRPAPPAPAKQSMQLLTRFEGTCTAEGTLIAARAAITHKKNIGLLAQRRPATHALAKQSMQLLTRFGGTCTAEGTLIAACSANNAKKKHWAAWCSGAPHPPALAKQSMQFLTGFGAVYRLGSIYYRHMWRYLQAPKLLDARPGGEVPCAFLRYRHFQFWLGSQFATLGSQLGPQRPLRGPRGPSEAPQRPLLGPNWASEAPLGSQSGPQRVGSQFGLWIGINKTPSVGGATAVL